MEEVVSKKNKRLKIFGIVLLTLILDFVFDLWFIIYFEPRDPRVFSDEEHIERISEKIKSKYIDKENSKYTSFEIYPVYNNNDELEYAVIDFQPEGFTYVIISEEGFFNDDRFLSKFNLLSTSMYDICSGYMDLTWRACSIDPDKKDEENLLKKIMYKDEKIYKNSPYYINNITDEKRYLISVKRYYNKERGDTETILIPCVIRDGEYLNLYSNEKFHIFNCFANTEQAVPGYIYFMAGLQFNL